MKNDWLSSFRAEYKPLLKDKYDIFEYNLSHPKAKHIRLQVSRNIDYLKELNNICSLEKLSGHNYNNVYKITDNSEKIIESISFQTGGVYILNPSSVAPIEILARYMKDNPVILDVSAAPGGKTCGLSDILNRQGLIIANEISSSRLKSLHFNLEKYGAYNVRTISMDGRLLANLFTNSFDGILLDAPCSNENKIFRNKKVQGMWSKELVLKMAELQRQLIKSAFLCLKVGGVLVYSTCTISLEENEYNIKYLLNNFDNAELLPIGEDYGKGISGISYIDENVARIMPKQNTMDGFFVAAIRKKGVHIPYNIKDTKLTNKAKDFFRTYYPLYNQKYISIKEYNKQGYVEIFPDLFKNIKFKRYGLKLYKDTGKMLEPTCQSIWQWGAYIDDRMKYNISMEEAQNFLKGFDITCDSDYNNGILFHGKLPIGYSKKVGEILKNKLDRYFLYGKNIEY